MSETPPQPPSFLSLALTLVESLIPAILVIWNNSLRQKNKELTVHLARETMDKNVAVFKAEEAAENDKKDSVTIIDDFLGNESVAGGTSPKDAFYKPK